MRELIAEDFIRRLEDLIKKVKTKPTSDVIMDLSLVLIQVKDQYKGMNFDQRNYTESLLVWLRNGEGEIPPLF